MGLVSSFSRKYSSKSTSRNFDTNLTNSPLTSVAYQVTITIGGVTTLVSETTETGLETVDQLGFRLSTIANGIAGINSIYNDQTNRIVLEAVEKTQHLQFN